MLVIVKDQWVGKNDEGKEFWTDENSRADTGGWYLLQGMVNGVMVTPGGRVPIAKKEEPE